AAEHITVDIYNDINILFGSKGTGKTAILEALSKYYNSKGHKTSVYKSSDAHLNDVFDLKGNRFSLEGDQIPFDECEKEIRHLKTVMDAEVTSLSKYYQHFAVQETNKIAQQLKIRNITLPDKKQPNQKFKEVLSIFGTFNTFNQFVVIGK